MVSVTQSLSLVPAAHFFFLFIDRYWHFLLQKYMRNLINLGFAEKHGYHLR